MQIANTNRVQLHMLLYCIQAAAYYYHGLLLDKGTADIDHVNALSCLLAADELLADCKRICLSFCLAKPVTRFHIFSGYVKFPL